MPRSFSGLPHSLEKLFADAPETLRLDNGLTVIFQQVPTQPIVSVQAWVKSGSIHEDQYIGSGLSHFLEHMLFKGTSKRKPGDIASEVQAFGGQINAYTAYDRTVYYIDGPSEALGHSLDLLADMTLNASLPQNELEKEREVILREIDMTLDDPDRIVSRALFSTAYREHSFQYPVIGHRPLFEQVSRDVLVNYYNARYQPDNMVLCVTGHFERESLLDLIGETFAKAPRNVVKPVSLAIEPDQLAYRESRLYADYNTARGILAFKIPSMRHEDAPALDILSAIIGSGHSGRLRQRLREDLELVHGISASTWNPGQPGLLYLQYQSAPEKAAKAEEAILETCQSFAKEGFTEEELEKALNFAGVSEVHTRQTVSGLASRLGLLGAIVGDPHYPEKYFEKIYNLTPQDLGTIAERYFQTDQLTVSTLLPEAHRPCARAAVSAKTLPPFEEKRLSNGARLIWQKDDRLPRTWIRYAGLGGVLYEAPSQKGGTSLLATMLTRDTEFQSASEVAEALESNGGFMVETSGNNTFSIGIEVMPDNIDQGIRALNDALLQPAFKEETLVRERDAQMALLHEIHDEILDFGRIALRRHFFGEHPFSSNSLGTVETVCNINRSSQRELYKNLIRGSNAVLVISGDFEPEVDLPKLEKLLLRIPEAPFKKQSLPFTQPKGPVDVQEHMDREQAVVFEAYPDTGLSPENEIVGSVLDELLSDMSGPLFRSVREDQSLAYYVGASRTLGYDYGCFYLYAGTQPSSTNEVLECFDKEMNRIRNGQVTEEELQAAVIRLKIQNRFSLQTPSGRATRVALNALYEKPLMDWLEFENRLNALTIKDLTAFASDYFRPEQRLRLIVSPK